MPVKAVKDLGTPTTRTFSDEVWKTGVPSKNGWKQIDYDTTMIAAKLPEQLEVKSKRKIEEVEVPPMPAIDEVEKEGVADFEPEPAIEKPKRGRKPNK